MFNMSLVEIVREIKKLNNTIIIIQGNADILGNGTYH